MATWQEKLEMYKTNPDAAIKEVIRAKQVYTEKQAAGDTAGMQAAHQWADQVRSAAGLDPASYGAGVTLGQAQSNYNAATQYTAPDVPTGTPSGTLTTGTGVVAQPNPQAPNATKTAPDYAAAIYAAMAPYTSYIEGLKQAKRQSKMAELAQAKESALSGLEAERATIKPYYYEAKNQAAAQSDIGAKNFAEYMAAQGIRGSAAGLPEIYRNIALQGQLGKLSQQEVAEEEDIARRKSDIESAYAYDVAQANADIDSQTMQAYIDAMKTAAETVRADLAAQGKTSTGELTLQGRQAQQNELAQQAALLAARYYDNIQAYINTLDPNDPLVPYLYAERQKKIQAQAEQAAAAVAAASEEEQRAWKRAFDLFQSTGRITSAEQARILGLPMDATVADVDIARMNAQTARINANKSSSSNNNSLYNSTYKNALTMAKDKLNYTEQDIYNYVYNVQGLTAQQKADIMNALYGE